MTKEFTSWWDFESFSMAVKQSARFIHSKKVITFLNTLLETSKHRHRHIDEGKYVWRAQLGCSTQEREQDGFFWEESVPYPSNRMKPLPYAAEEGRVNPKGIPCLYAASDKETAMAEVRPWIGSSVSVGQLRLTHKLTLIDFSVGHDSGFDFHFDEPSPEEREKSVWSQVDRAFSMPITTNPSTAEYVPTQVISEFFKKEGFDGVVYKSKLGPGFNLALFDLDAAELVNCALYPVKSVSFTFGEIENAYQVKSDDTPKK